MDTTKPFQCDLCGIGLDSRRQASKHFDKVHNGKGNVMSTMALVNLDGESILPYDDPVEMKAEDIKLEEEDLLVLSSDDEIAIATDKSVTAPLPKTNTPPNKVKITSFQIKSPKQITLRKKIQISSVPQHCLYNKDLRNYFCTICLNESAQFSTVGEFTTHYENDHIEPSSRFQYQCEKCPAVWFDRKSDLEKHCKMKACRLDTRTKSQLAKSRQIPKSLKHVLITRESGTNSDSDSLSVNGGNDILNSLTEENKTTEKTGTPSTSEEIMETEETMEATDSSAPPFATKNIRDNCIFNWKTRRYCCKLCKKTFCRRNTFQDHFECIHLNLRLKCEFCPGLKFTTQDTLRKHVNKVHPELQKNKPPKYVQLGTDKYSCTICNKVFDAKNKVLAHQIYHKVRNKKCDKCNRVFTFQRNLSMHRCINQIDKVKCGDCNKSFINQNNLDAHQSYCRRKPNSIVTEKSPATSLKNENDPKTDVTSTEAPASSIMEPEVVSLDNQPQSKHFRFNWKTRRFICSICKSIFSQKHTLQDHLENVHFFNKPILDHSKKLGERERKQQRCNVCAKSFPDIQGLRKHYHAVHLESFQLCCDICGKVFPKKSKLTAHRRKLHAGLKHLCVETCGRSYVLRTKLRQHQSDCQYYLEYLSDLDDFDESSENENELNPKIVK